MRILRIGKIQILTGFISTSKQNYILDYSAYNFKFNPKVSISNWGNSVDLITHSGRGVSSCPFQTTSPNGLNFDYIIIGEI